LHWRIVDDAKLALGENAGEEAKMELPALDDAARQNLRDVFAWRYEFDAATRQAAKTSVTALRRQAEELDEEAKQLFAAERVTHPIRSTSGKLSAADAGVAMHKFLQNVALDKTGTTASLEDEARQMEKTGILSAEECAVLDLAAVAAFWKSEPGKKILTQSDNVKRELAFTARFSPQGLAEIMDKSADAKLADEFVVVQGVADLVVLLPKEIWLLDFKTDQVRANDLPAKRKLYEPQLKLYARALEKIYSRPVTRCWLHFLSIKKTLDAG
jgi:ATP-dependent helicase/nuclease subunit A